MRPLHVHFQVKIQSISVDIYQIISRGSEKLEKHEAKRHWGEDPQVKVFTNQGLFGNFPQNHLFRQPGASLNDLVFKVILSQGCQTCAEYNEEDVFKKHAWA